MDLARAKFTFSDDREIEVFESTWESSSTRARIEEKARADRLKLNGSGDPVFLFFLESFYSYLASCSSGDVPSAEEAYTLPDEDLDRWLESVLAVNPDSSVRTDLRARGEVVFRDGLRLEIISSYLLSASMKRARLEEEGYKREPDRENPKDIFSVYLYPLLASCSIGPVPSAEEVRAGWPESEIYKWRDAIEEINPHLFGTDTRSQAETRAVEKKSRRRPVKSQPS